ncbi:unnamed protein product, partial [Symbiodinium pilosum]
MSGASNWMSVSDLQRRLVQAWESRTWPRNALRQGGNLKTTTMAAALSAQGQLSQYALAAQWFAALPCVHYSKLVLTRIPDATGRQDEKVDLVILLDLEDFGLTDDTVDFLAAVVLNV